MATLFRPGGAGLVLLAATLLGSIRAVAGEPPSAGEPKTPETLSGAARGMDGRAAAGARLYLILTRYEPGADTREVVLAGTASADAAGRFRFTRLPQLTKYSYLAVVARHGERVGLARFAPEAGAEPLTLTLRPPRTMRGVVRDSAGKGLAGVWVKPRMLHIQVAQSGGSTTWASTELPEDLQRAWATRSDAKGTYAVPLLMDNASGSLNLELSGYNKALTWVNSGEAAPRETVLHRQTRVSGRLKLENPAMPLTGIRVLFTVLDKQGTGDRGAGAAVKPDGTFTLEDVPPGTGQLTLFVPRTSEWQPTPTMPLSVVEGKSQEGVVLAVPATRGVTVRGRVVDEATGKGIPGFWINLPSGEGLSTDDSGEYQFYAPAGAVRVQVYQASATDYLIPEQGLTRAGTGAAGETLTLEEMRFRKGLSITVRVVDTAGKPVRGATVRNQASPSPWSEREQVTDAKGEFTLKGIRPEVPLKLFAGSPAGFTTPVEVKPQTPGPVVLVVRPELAARLTGRVVDDAGNPVRDAMVQVTAMYGRWGDYPAVLKTDKTGRFRSEALPPAATYTLNVRAARHRSTTSGKWETTTGGEHDFGTLRMVRQLGIVEGIVVDAGGKPVKGVRVFNSGDADERLQTTSDAAGRFRLEGLEKGACFVFAEKPGHPLGIRRVDTPATGVRLVLATPRLSAATAALTAARQRFAEQLLDQGIRETEGKKERAGDRRRIVELLAARDPLRATEIAETAGPGGRDALTTRLAYVALPRSVDEAIACVREVADPWWRTYHLLQLAGAASRQQAGKVLAATVASARAVPDPIQQLYFLAEAGDRMRKLGLPGAETLVRESATRASRIGVEGQEGYFRGTVAERLAEIDLDAAMGLLAPMTTKDERLRHLINIAVRYSTRSPEQALRMLESAGMQSWEMESALSRMCVRLAVSQPDKAETLLAKLGQHTHRIEALLWMAERHRDRKHAQAALARAERELRDWAARDRGENAYDSPVLYFARAALIGRRIGYPGTADLLVRALASRPPLGSRYGNEHDRKQLQAKLAVVVSLVDPALGRDFANIVVSRFGHARIPDSEWMETQLRQQVLLAAANAAPERATAYLQSLPPFRRRINPLDAAEFLLNDKTRQEQLYRILSISSPEEDN